MAQQFDPVLEVMVSPHMKLVQSTVGGGKANKKKKLRADLDPVGIQAVANELFEEADLDGDGLLDSEEFKIAYAKWEAETKGAGGETPE